MAAAGRKSSESSGEPLNAVHGGVGPERGHEAEHLAARVDEPRPGKLPEPHDVRAEHAEVQRQHHRRRPDGHRPDQHRDAGLGEVGVLAESDRDRPQYQHHDGQQDHGDRLLEPALVHRQGGGGGQPGRQAPAAGRSARAACRRPCPCLRYRRSGIEPGPELAQEAPRPGDAVAAEGVHQRAADDHAVGQSSDGPGLLRGGDAEADGHGERGGPPHALDRFGEARRRGSGSRRSRPAGPPGRRTPGRLPPRRPVAPGGWSARSAGSDPAGSAAPQAPRPDRCPPAGR